MISFVCSFFTQILMNAQWIQAHVVQERVWIWTALTGVSAHLATISTRKPVKVQQTKASPFCIIVNRQVKTWQIKTQIHEVIKYLHAGVNLTSGMAENTYSQHGHTHTPYMHTHSAEVYRKRISYFLHLLLRFNRLAATNRPSSPFHMWKWAQARTLWLFIQWGWWRDIRQTSTHSCYVLCSWKQGGKALNSQHQ